VSDTPETDKQAVNVIGWYSCATVPADFARGLERKRNAAERALTLIADDCEAWLRSESDEPSAEFIKLVAKYARNHLTQ
jgi:hypothetical protein